MPRIPLAWPAAVLVPSAALAYTNVPQATAPATPTGSNLARTHPIAPLVVAANWPPKPQDIVNLTGQTSPIPTHGTEVIYTVPPDRWLVGDQTELLLRADA